jgi:transcriptional regulator with XRE-family HTH domain
MPKEQRCCDRCHGLLASDNPGPLCRNCQSADARRSARPAEVAAGFWLDGALHAALDSRHMGRVIRAYRHHPHHGRRGLTQDVVAGWTGISQGQLSDIERGAPINDLERLITWALLLGIPEQHLWFKLPGSGPSVEVAGIPPTGDPHPMIRDAGGSLQESSLAAERAAALGVDLWNLLDALEATRVSDTSLALAEEACARLDTRYAELPPTVLLPELRRQLNHVVAWLKEPQPVSHRQRLSTVASRLAGLRAWLYFDMAELDAANAWFTAAVRAAQEADNHDLSGYLLGAQSLIPTERHDWVIAAQLLEGAQTYARRGSHTTRAWLDILEARSLAARGDASGFRTAYRYAEKRLGRTTLDERHHGMDFAGGHLDLTYYQGLSHLLLHKPREAAEAFGTALEALPTSRIKARAILLLSLAIALAQHNKHDHAVAAATEALTIANDQPIGRVHQRADDLRRELGPAAGSTLVRDLDEQVHAFERTLERAITGPTT